MFSNFNRRPSKVDTHLLKRNPSFWPFTFVALESNDTTMSRITPGGRRRPLYPMAWGAGTKAFESTYKCYSVAAAGREDLENGDKILMPEKAFREVSRLRLQFPLTMMARNARKGGPPSQSRSRGGSTSIVNTRGGRKKSSGSSSSGQDPFIQYCGVLEFSSPDGVCHLPHWMMESLNLKEGGRVTLRSAKPLPKGDFAKFQPHKEEFLDFAMALGVRNVLELAMQHYSALAVGQTVLIQYGNDKYMLDVVEVSPGSAISLYGTVDLKVEFAPVPGSAAALAAAAEAAAANAANKENSLQDGGDGDNGSGTESIDSPPASSTRRSGAARSTTRSSRAGGPTTPASKRDSKNRARPRPGAGSQRSTTRSSPITPRGGRDAKKGATTTPRGSKGHREQIVGGSKASNASKANSSSGRRKKQENAKTTSAAPSPNSTAAIEAMAVRRKEKLSKFSKRGSLRAAGSSSKTASGTSHNNNNNVVGSAAPATSPIQPPLLGRSLASGATVPMERSTRTTESGGSTTAHEEAKPAPTWGTGYTLNNSKKVHSSEPIAQVRCNPILSVQRSSILTFFFSINFCHSLKPPPIPSKAAAAAAAAAPEGEQKTQQVFAGKGATLGGTIGGSSSGSSGSSGNSGNSGVAEKPWVAAARARHAKHAKKKAEENRRTKEAEDKVKEETATKCRAIAEAAAAAMSEEEKKDVARKAELEQARLAMESQIENKLLRDAELKRKREGRFTSQYNSQYNSPY